MEIAIERRNEEAPRVPMGEVTVELSQSDRAESFGAESFGVDGVNLGLGGLSLRASQLPRVGAPFRCRFSFPEDERFVVEAAAEVVWTADRGRHTGEFGLRFTDVGPSSRRMIESMVLKQMTSYGSIHVPLRKPMAQSVAASSRSLSTRTEPQSIPASDQPVVDREASWNSPSPEVVSPEEDLAEETQLFLERVSTPILASVVHRVDDCLIVEQELPFLRIGMGIREGAEGRLGTLQTVELRMERDVPRLLLGVLWDAEQSGEPTSGEQRSGEESSGEQKSGEASSVTTLPQIHDDTVHDTLLPFGLRVAANAQANPIRSLPESRDGRIQPTEERLVDAAPSSSEVPHEFLANLERSRSGEPLDAQRSLTGSSKESSAQTGREVLEDARTAVVQVGNGFLVILQRIQPVLRVLTAVGARLLSGVKQRALFRFIRVQPTFDRMRSMFPSKSLFPGLQMRSRRKQAAMKKRPQTSRAKVRVQGQSRRTEPAPSVSRSRPVILAVLALAGVGSAGYAFWPSKPELPPSAAPDPSYADALSLSSQDTRSAAPPPTTASPAVAASSSAPSGSNTAAASVPTSMPTALGEPQRSSGLIASPRFPSLDGAPAPQEPRSLPEGSPYAVDVRGGAAPTPPASATQSFGDPDAAGRTYHLRMSRTVEFLRGVPEARGFSITAHGALSLDRAGPIARNHPLIERSMILNRGDHSELSIQFVRGAQPAYRVSIRGNSLELVVSDE